MAYLILTIIGWVILVWITLKAQDRIVKNQSTIKAYELLEERIRRFSESLGQLLGYVSILKANVKRILHEAFVTDKDYVKRLINLSNKCSQSEIEMVEAYQSYQFILDKFGSIRQVIGLEHKCINELYWEFFDIALRVVPMGKDSPNVSTEHKDSPNVSTEDKNKFDNLADKLCEELRDLQCYLYDFRIAVQNELLKPIFKTEVPVRQPSDPTVKVLTLDNVKEFIRSNKERYKKWLPGDVKK